MSHRPVAPATDKLCVISAQDGLSGLAESYAAAVPSAVFWLLPVGSVLLGSMFVVHGLRNLTTDRQRRENWLTYPGRVVGSRTVGSGLSDDLSADQTQCQVAYLRDGREVVFWNRFTSTMVRSPEGRTVQVLVNPADPRDAVVSQGLAAVGRTVGAFFVVAGAFFVIVGLGVGAGAILR